MNKPTFTSPVGKNQALLGVFCFGDVNFFGQPKKSAPCDVYLHHMPPTAKQFSSRVGTQTAH